MSDYIELLKACKEGNHKKVKKLLTVCKNISDVRDLTDKTLLHYCFKHRLCADLLLEQCPELINVGDKAGYTVLHVASIINSPNHLEYILSKNADINKRNNDSRTALMLAVIYGNVETIEMLCKCGAEVNIVDNDGVSPLHYAAKAVSKPESEEDHNKIIDILVEQNANLECNDPYNRTPIIWAACSNNLSRMKYLIAKGANINVSDLSGLTLLHYAASNDNLKMIEELIDEYNFEINVKDHKGCTPLMYACTTKHKNSAKLLLSKGAQPNAVDLKQRNCAHFVSAKGDVETLKLLLEYEAELWNLNSDNNYPLHEACYRGHLDTVQFLLQHPPNFAELKDIINKKNSNNQTPLHLAAVKNHEEICGCLFSYSADPNITLRAPNGKSMTALDLCSNEETKSIIKSNEGKTAEHLIKRAPIKEEPTISMESESESEVSSEKISNSKSNIINNNNDNNTEQISDEMLDDPINLSSDDLLNAVMKGNLGLVKSYIKHFGTIKDVVDKTGKTPFHYSLKNDDSFEYIRETYPELVNVSDYSNICPLTLAIMSKSNSRIEQLLQMGADLNHIDNNGLSILHTCVGYRNLEALKILNDYFNEKNKYVTGNIFPHCKDKKGQYPLHYAIELIKSKEICNNELEYLRILLQMKPDIECQDNVNRTPLLLAVNVQYVEAVRLLLENEDVKPNILAKDSQGLTALHYVCAQGNLAILNLLAECTDFDPNIRDPNGLTPIFYAVASCNYQFLERMIELNPQLDITDYQSRTLCHKAAEKGAFRSLELLIEKNVDPWLSSADGSIPLHEAAYRGYKEVAEILLNTESEGKNVNRRNNSQQTPLHLAVVRNDCPMCYLLLANGAGVNDSIPDSNTGDLMNPLDLATTQDCREILLNYGGRSAKSMANGTINSDEKIKLEIDAFSTLTFNRMEGNDPILQYANECNLTDINTIPHSITLKDSETISRSKLNETLDLTTGRSGTLTDLMGTQSTSLDRNHDASLNDNSKEDKEDILNSTNRNENTQDIYQIHTPPNASIENNNEVNASLPVSKASITSKKKCYSKPNKSASISRNGSVISKLQNGGGTTETIEEKIKISVINYEYIRISAKLAAELARRKIREENIQKLLEPKTPKLLRRGRTARLKSAI